MAWQEYEKEVFENLSMIFLDAKLEFNSELLGKYSNGLRQCDTIIRQVINGIEYVTLVDAKYYSEKIDAKDVETFISIANRESVNKNRLLQMVVKAFPIKVIQKKILNTPHKTQ